MENVQMQTEKAQTLSVSMTAEQAEAIRQYCRERSVRERKTLTISQLIKEAIIKYGVAVNFEK